MTILTALVHNGNLRLLVTFDSCVLDSLRCTSTFQYHTPCSSFFFFFYHHHQRHNRCCGHGDNALYLYLM